MIDWQRKRADGWWHAEWRGWRLYIWPCINGTTGAEVWGYSVTCPDPRTGVDVCGGVTDTLEEARAAAKELLQSLLTGHERAALAREGGR